MVEGVCFDEGDAGVACYVVRDFGFVAAYAVDVDVGLLKEFLGEELGESACETGDADFSRHGWRGGWVEAV